MNVYSGKGKMTFLKKRGFSDAEIVKCKKVGGKVLDCEGYSMSFRMFLNGEGQH